MNEQIGILGLGAYVPERVLTNADLERMVETSDEWITTRTGIKERRIARDDEPTSDLAAQAGRIALADAGIDPAAIDLIIVATVTGDMIFPSTACLVQAKIGAFSAACFDVAAACTGFMYAMTTADRFLRTGMYQTALVIGAEKMSVITDWKDRNTCVLFGDGAGACVLGKTTRRVIVSSYLGADGRQADLLKVPAGGSQLPATEKTVAERLHYIRMEGSEVFKNAVQSMVDAAQKALAIAGLTPADIGLFIPHQANSRILKSVANRLNLDPARVFSNVERYGNTSGASTAVALFEAAQAGRIREGDIVVLDAFGAGFTKGAIVIRW